MTQAPKLGGSIFGLTYHGGDSSRVLEDYVAYLANDKLLSYKTVVHTGGKAGESLWTHVMNLVTTVEKLRPLFRLTANEMRCLLLALTVHDINKLDEYGKRSDGKGRSYANAATHEHIEDLLARLEAQTFFPAWKEYRLDIKFLADAHQEMSQQATQFDQRYIDRCWLEGRRLKGPLKALMKLADVSDNSHSGAYAAPGEIHVRDKLIKHLNAALNSIGHPRRYRFVGHRLAELRGIQTNIIHNQFVALMKATYGEEACIDLLYHPEGVDYLLDTRISLDWTPEMQRTFARQLGKKFAAMQADQLAQFIKAKPSGISVDDAAIESGASPQEIFTCIGNIVLGKQYTQEWREQRNTFARRDVETFLAGEQGEAELKAAARRWLEEGDLVPAGEDALKRGELLMAYRNFLKDHCVEQLKALKQEAWVRVSRLFLLPPDRDALYSLIDPYRRGYVMARDLPEQSIDDRIEAALADLEQLEQQAQTIAEQRRAVKAAQAGNIDSETEPATQEASPAGEDFLLDYIQRHLEVWDSQAPVPIQTVQFVDSLRRYADQKRPDAQCCYCGSPLKAEEWMALQVPTSIGVQSFSNRLEGGSAREPKRNVCAVCRTQFILEKLAWSSHRDKQGHELATFYVHLFPYSYFTQPMLHAWWESVKRVRDGNYRALFLYTRDHEQWEQLYHGFQVPLVRYQPSKLEGVGIPVYAEALSNTPVLPLILSGNGYGKKFLRAVEITLLLAAWFDCRVLLSRLPTPLLNLTNEYLARKPSEREGEKRDQKEPVALFIEGIPQAMSWLLPRPALTRPQVSMLCGKISALHHLVELLTSADDQFDTVLYDLISAAAHDPLALYHEADRLIEAKVAQRKIKGTAITLSHQVAPLLEQLLQGEENE